MRSRLATFLVYALVCLATLTGTGWIGLEWQRQLDSSRARLLASHTRRMVEHPGVEAWLVSLLERAGARLPFDERQRYDKLRLTSGNLDELPQSALAIAKQLHAPSTAPVTLGLAMLTELAPVETTRKLEYMRTVQHVRLGDQTLVLTRRRALSEPGPLDAELERAAAHLIALSHDWTRTPAPSHSFTDSKLVLSEPALARFYVIAEDGSVLIMPVPGSSPDPLAEQTAQAWRRPLEPSLASMSNFAQFDFGRPLTTQVHYTGLYPDITGLGFVATVAIPVRDASTGAKLIFAADLTVEISLDELIAGADSLSQLEIADVTDEVDTPTWKPWTKLATSIAPDAPTALREEIHEQTLLESPVERRPLVSAKTARGVLFAQQIQRDKWLVGFAQAPTAPWPLLLLVPLSLIGLLTWAERRRTRVERERDAAQRRIEQRDAALELLALPLVVVDPNDDAVVHANSIAARELGLLPGRIVHEHLVATDARSQKHYQDHQVLVGGRRRAYGIRLRPDPNGPGFALIRSISLTEALPDFHAAANHRLALICPIEGDADLAPMLADELAGARQDERNKLATLIDHGVDMLARVLAAQLQSPVDDNLQFRRWLADYLFSRLHVIQWVLDHWGGPVCHDIDCILGPDHLRAAITQYQRIFAAVGRDPQLRAQLLWHNGTLAAPIPADADALKVWIDWPDEYRLTTPAEGLFGYFLGEVLINAIKHGTPGVPIEFDVDLDRARRELSVRVRNILPSHAGDSREDKTYGGSAILAELARVCGWQLARTLEHERFELRWTCPVTLQRAPGQVD